MVTDRQVPFNQAMIAAWAEQQRRLGTRPCGIAVAWVRVTAPPE
jgi:hypothetical protein